jgi:methyltransferase (TIGR00027 family)
MHDDFPSVTAMSVSFARGLSGAGAGAVRDPIASSLLPSGVGALLRGAAKLAHERPAVERALGLASLNLVDHVGLRTAAIDHAVNDAIALGARQLVIVGAGLDARAHRLTGLSNVDVFEVDHPATQALKRTKAEGLERTARSITYVTVDFARETVDTKLAASGHRADVPTVFVWEGVTMYLPRAATEGTLQALASVAAPKSTLAVTYVEPELAHMPAALRPAVLSVFAAVGEPVIGAMKPSEMAELLRRHRFSPIEDSGTSEWKRRHGRHESRFVLTRERLAVART